MLGILRDTMIHVSSFLSQTEISSEHVARTNTALGRPWAEQPSPPWLAIWGMPHTVSLSLGNCNIAQKVKKPSLQESYLIEGQNKKELTFFWRPTNSFHLTFYHRSHPVTGCVRALSLAPLLAETPDQTPQSISQKEAPTTEKNNSQKRARIPKLPIKRAGSLKLLNSTFMFPIWL